MLYADWVWTRCNETNGWKVGNDASHLPFARNDSHLISRLCIQRLSYLIAFPFQHSGENMRSMAASSTYCAPLPPHAWNASPLFSFLLFPLFPFLAVNLCSRLGFSTPKL